MNPASHLLLPATDDEMPGAGPVRRADWFLPIWEERRALFATRIERDQRTIVFLGDSITSGWGDTFKGHFPGAHFANRGISGDTTRGMLYRLQADVLTLNPRAIVLLAGTNDLEENAPPSLAADNLRLILDALIQHQAQMPILLCEVFPSAPKNNRPPATIRELNALYAGLAAERPTVTMVRTWEVFADESGNAREEHFPDLLHPNDLGYAKWANALHPVLAALP